MAFANEILDQSIRRLNELVPATPVRWTRVEILVFLNDAIHELNLLSGDIQRTVAVNINNTANVWNFPDGIIAPLALRVENRYLYRESIENLDREDDWELPSKIRLNPTTWCPLGFYKFIVYPRPINARIINAEVLHEHTPVTDAAVALPVRPEYERCLEDYIVSRALFKEGGAETHQGLAFYDRFLDTVTQLTGRNVLRSYPIWDEWPTTKTSEMDLRQGAQAEPVKDK
jgi:hypothetical protein